MPIPLKGVNSIGADSFFIRLKDKADFFVHYEGVNPSNNSEVVYLIRQGAVGACVWKKDKGLAFITHSGASNLELVPVKEVVSDNSGN